MGKTLRVLKLAVIRYPNALGGFRFHRSPELVFPYAFLTWKIFIIFQVVVVRGFHSITPSLPVRHLKTRGSSHMKRQGRQKYRSLTYLQICEYFLWD